MNSSIQHPPSAGAPKDWQRQTAEGSRSGSTTSQRTARGDAPERAEVNVASLLAQSAEELTQVVATRVQSRTLKERKLSDSTIKPPDREQLQALREAFAAGRESGQGKPQATQAQSAAQRGLGDQVGALLKKVKERPSSALKEVAESVGSDPTEQYLVLLDMAYRLQDENAGGDSERNGEAEIWEALEELSAEHGETIRADLNTFEATRGLAPTEAAGFRTAYKDVVLASEGLADVSKHVLKATNGDTGEAFLKTLKNMISALGMDLSSARASTEPAKLKSLLSDLHNLETLATVIDRCHDLGQTLSKRHGAPPLQPTALAADLVALSGERWMDSMRVGRVGDKHGGQHSLSTAVDLLTGMRNALRDLPVWSFQSAEARDSILEAAQDAMDAAIDREEGYA